MKKYFFVVEIKQTNWNYKIGQKLTSLVFAKNVHFARIKFEREHSGSDYPMYNVISITEGDSFLFSKVIK